MMLYEICITVETEIDLVLRRETIDSIMSLVSKEGEELLLKSILIKPLSSITIGSIVDDKVAKLSGRSRIIVDFLYNNEGSHSTSEISDVVNNTIPFKNKSILHSYLNNLVSRGIIVKVSSGWYRANSIRVSL